MSSGISTSAAARAERRAPARDQPGADSGFQVWHFYMLLSMVGATAAVVVSRNTNPVALLLLSAAAIFTGLVGFALHRALAGFFSDAKEPPVMHERLRDELLREKALVLRSIKELEFDRSMGKVSDADFANIGGRLRARALVLMQDLERPQPAAAAPAVADGPVAAAGATVAPAHASAVQCVGCGTTNEADARFCKHCGRRLDL